MTDECKVVTMDEVPEPPAVGLRNGRRSAIYAKIRSLGTDQKRALRIECKDKKDLSNTRTQLQQMAIRDGRRLLTSRNQESTVLWAWTVKKDAKL